MLDNQPIQETDFRSHAKNLKSEARITLKIGYFLLTIVNFFKKKVEKFANPFTRNIIILSPLQTMSQITKRYIIASKNY